mgnify:CR=1 FL=1
MATAVTEYQGPTISWPAKLREIRITKKEKALLEGVIKSLYKRLPPPAENRVFTAGKRRDPKGKVVPRRVTITHDHAWIFLNTHGKLPPFNMKGRQQKNIKYVWDCFANCLYLKKQLEKPSQYHIVDWFIQSPEIGHSSWGFPSLALDRENHGKLRYLEKLAECTLGDWYEKADAMGPDTFLIVGMRVKN